MRRALYVEVGGVWLMELELEMGVSVTLRSPGFPWEIVGQYGAAEHAQQGLRKL